MSPEPRSRRFEALGGECELFAIDAGEAYLDAAAAWVREQGDRFTRFDPESELSRFNASAGAWARVSTDLALLLRAALDAYETSGGLVHAGVLPSLLAAGYTRTFRDGPTIATLERARPLPPLPELLEVRGRAARLAPGAAVDLGGIAKGWLADRCCRRLGANALANLGGDLCARGPGPTGDGWPVGFADRTLLLRDLGAATSGTRRRRWGDGLHHLIDPRTGLPARTGLSEASVLADTAARAEVLAKTAVLLGPGRAEGWLSGRARGWALA
jgi:thiamine biosynthesis lipoprotein